MLEMKKTVAPVEMEDVVNELKWYTELLQMVLDYFSEYIDSEHTDRDKDIYHTFAERYYILTGQVFGQLNDLRERCRLTDKAYSAQRDELLKHTKAIMDNL